MNTFFRPIAPLAVSVTVVAASFAHGADVLLTPIDWSVSGAAGVIAGGTTVPISPLGNAQFGYVSTAGGVYDTSPLVLRDEGNGSENQTNGTKVRLGSFQATANETLDLYFNYVSTDGRGYDDYAWARLIDAGNQSTAAWPTHRAQHQHRERSGRAGQRARPSGRQRFTERFGRHP